MTSSVFRSVIAAALCGLVLAIPNRSRAIQVGQVAPDFTLQEIDGTPHHLYELRGNLVLLAFVGYA
jgi:cytochrome oxidase Cu insertion factor (SCO1/SenC/PrrC family)